MSDELIIGSNKSYEELYVEIKGYMKDHNIYYPEDELAIQSLAQNIVVSNKLVEAISEYGAIFETLSDRGATTYKQNPAVKGHADIQGKIHAQYDALGLTTKSRKGDNGGDGSKTVLDFLNG